MPTDTNPMDDLTEYQAVTAAGLMPEDVVVNYGEVEDITDGVLPSILPDMPQTVTVRFEDDTRKTWLSTDVLVIVSRNAS